MKDTAIANGNDFASTQSSIESVLAKLNATVVSCDELKASFAITEQQDSLSLETIVLGLSIGVLAIGMPFCVSMALSLLGHVHLTGQSKVAVQVFGLAFTLASALSVSLIYKKTQSTASIAKAAGLIGMVLGAITPLV